MLFEDDDLIAVTKPIGVSVHPRHRFEAGSILNRVVHHLGGRAPYVVHRCRCLCKGALRLCVTAARNGHA